MAALRKAFRHAAAPEDKVAIAGALAGDAAPPLPAGAAPQAFERRELTRQLAVFLRDCRERRDG